jgi:soluble cytochrome b562
MENLKSKIDSMSHYTAMNHNYDNNSLNTGLTQEKAKLSNIEKGYQQKLADKTKKEKDYNESEALKQSLIDEKQNQGKLKSVIDDYLTDYRHDTDTEAVDIDQLIGDLSSQAE